MKRNGFVFRKIANHKYLRNLILSYITLIVISAALIAAFLYYSFSVAAAKGIGSYAKLTTNQISFASDLVYNQVVTLNNQLEMDTDIINFVNHSSLDKVSRYQIATKLKNIQAMYPFIKSICIDDMDDKSSLDTQNYPVDSDAVEKNSNRYLYFYPRKVKMYETDTPKDFLTFVFYPKLYQADSKKFAIIMNIDQNYMMELIDTLGSQSANSSFYVFNAQGTVVSASDSEQFLKNFSGVGYVKDILKKGDPQGNSLFEKDGQKYVICYVKSPAFGWYTVSVSPYNFYVSNIIDMKNMLFLVIFLTLVVGLILATLFTKMQYRPMENLIAKIGVMDASTPVIDEYKLLSDTLAASISFQNSTEANFENMMKYTKRFCLSSLFKGTNKSMFTRKLREIVETNFTGPYFRVLLLKIDHFADVKKSDNILIAIFAVQNIVTEVLKQKFGVDYIQTEENELSFLLQYSRQDAIGEVYPMISVIQQIMEENFSLSLSAAVSEEVEKADDLQSAYRSAAEFIKYRLFYGHGCVINSAFLQDRLHAPSGNPAGLCRKIIESLRLNNRNEARNAIQAYFSAISEESYYQAIALSNEAASEISKNFSDCVPFSEEIRIINRVNNSETLEEISLVIWELCEKICDAADENAKQRTNLKNAEVVEKIEACLNEHYSDPNLSLTAVADGVRLSPGYVRKLFKAYKGLSFSEYLTGIRLEKAKELLETTSEPISKVCEKIGILNVNYFFTLFKKAYGTTPSVFREKKQGGL